MAQVESYLCSFKTMVYASTTQLQLSMTAFRKILKKSKLLFIQNPTVNYSTHFEQRLELGNNLSSLRISQP